MGASDKQQRSPANEGGRNRTPETSGFRRRERRPGDARWYITCNTKVPALWKESRSVFVWWVQIRIRGGDRYYWLQMILEYPHEHRARLPELARNGCICSEMIGNGRAQVELLVRDVAKRPVQKALRP